MSNERNGQRRRFTAQEKVAILRGHLVEKAAVSEVCDKHGLNPTVFYRWRKEFFEKGAMVFERRDQRPNRQLAERVEAVQGKCARKARRRQERIGARASRGNPIDNHRHEQGNTITRSLSRPRESD